MTVRIVQLKNAQPLKPQLQSTSKKIELYTNSNGKLMIDK